MSQGGKLSNLVINFDVDLESSCSTIYVAPFVSSGGSLENVTITGEIRAKGTIGILNACNIFGFALGKSFAKDIYTNLRFFVNNIEYAST